MCVVVETHRGCDSLLEIRKRKRSHNCLRQLRGDIDAELRRLKLDVDYAVSGSLCQAYWVIPSFVTMRLIAEARPERYRGRS